MNVYIDRQMSTDKILQINASSEFLIPYKIVVIEYRIIDRDHSEFKNIS